MKNLIIFLVLVPFISLAQIKLLPKSQGELLDHTYYSLSYLEDHEQAEWAHYRLNIAMLKGKIPRKNSFKSDELVSTKSATLADYKNSGYDRGHLVPAGDMKLSKKSMSESFYMSNISPQRASFNRGIWNTLENQVRLRAKRSELYVSTGGILNSKKLLRIGRNKVSVPDQFYKIIYDAKNQKMFAYLIPNKKLDSLEKYIVTVDLIEVLTGIDFYHELDDELENKLESAKNNLSAKLN
tara:strand:- start:11171 stop:11887 length:717 start_codon:yes stop_codon:yes gene_type:complete